MIWKFYFVHTICPIKFCPSFRLNSTNIWHYTSSSLIMVRYITHLISWLYICLWWSNFKDIVNDLKWSRLQSWIYDLFIAIIEFHKLNMNSCYICLFPVTVFKWLTIIMCTSLQIFYHFKGRMSLYTLENNNHINLGHDLVLYADFL